MPGKARLTCWRQGRWSPIAPQIVSIHDHLRLVLRLRTREARIHIEILGPRVARTELQTAAQSTDQFQLKSVVAAIAFRVPEETIRQIGIRTCGDRNVSRILSNSCPRRSCAACYAARVCTCQRRNTIGVDAEQSVISKRAGVRGANRHVGCNTLFDCEVPFVDRWRLCGGLDSLRGKGTAVRRKTRTASRRRLHAVVDWQKIEY